MRNKRKTIIFLMLILSCILVLLSGCKWDSRGTKKKVEAKLKEKYNQSFSTSAIGDRWNTDYTRLYCYPADDRSILFEVVYYDNGEMTDDYIERKCECEVEKEIVSKLKTVDVNCISKVTIWATGRDINKNYANMSVNEYLEDVKGDLSIDLAINVESIKTEEDAEKIVKVLEEVSNNHNSVKLVSGVYFVKGEQYSDVENYFKNYTSITEASMDKFVNNSDKSRRKTVICVNRTKGSQTEIYPISIMEAAKVH